MDFHEQIVRVFVASPGDVAEERNELEEIVSDLNLTWGKTLRIRLDLIRWETHVNPGIGEYPQEVVNRQIGSYDVFIGMLWTRFGTETPDYGSGTEEEFNMALRGFRREKRPSDIMIYFKESPMSPSRIEPEQLMRVFSFKRGLGGEGVLYWNFSDRQEFDQLLRLHLSRVAQRFSELRIDRSNKEGLGDEPTDPDDEELGFLDHLELGLGAFDVCSATLTRITEAINKVGSAMERRSEEVNSLYDSEGNYDIREMKRAASRMAQDMAEFARRIEVEVPIFRESYGGALDHVCGAATLSIQDFKPSANELETLQAKIGIHKEVIPTVIEQIAGLKASVARMPRVTVVFNRAKKEAIASLDRQLDALEFARRASVESDRLLSELLHKLRR